MRFAVSFHSILQYCSVVIPCWVMAYNIRQLLSRCVYRHVHVLLSRPWLCNVVSCVGIGAVPWIHFDSTSLCTEWGKPYTSNDISSDVMYEFSFTGDDIFLSATTTFTYFCLFVHYAPCQAYNIIVKPFSIAPDYTGPVTSTSGKIDGGNLSLSEQLTKHTIH